MNITLPLTLSAIVLWSISVCADYDTARAELSERIHTLIRKAIDLGATHSELLHACNGNPTCLKHLKDLTAGE